MRSLAICLEQPSLQEFSTLLSSFAATLKPWTLESVMVQENDLKIRFLRIWEGFVMKDENVILAMAICEILGKSISEKDVLKAMDKAKKRLDQSRRPPTEAIVTRGGRRE